MITLLDYGAGNVRSVINAIERLGETVKIVTSGKDILSAEKLVFPGVGAFGNMMKILSYNDPDPIPAGGIAFESVQEDEVLIDNIEIWGEGETLEIPADETGETAGADR